MPEVFHNEDQIVCVGPEWIDRLKAAAAASPLRRSRLRLHLANADPVQEMIIALCRDVLLRPHRHSKKTESFHMIEGDLYVLVFDDDGQVRQTVHMGPPGTGRVLCYRLCVSAWHAIVPRSEFVVFHESTAGPFRPDETPEFAPWAPTGTEALRQFLESSLQAGLATHQIGVGDAKA